MAGPAAWLLPVNAATWLADGLVCATGLWEGAGGRRAADKKRE